MVGSKIVLRQANRVYAMIDHRFPHITYPKAFAEKSARKFYIFGSARSPRSEPFVKRSDSVQRQTRNREVRPIERMGMFNIRPKIDIWDSPVAIDQHMNFEVFGAWRPDPDDTLSGLIFPFLKKLLHRAEPIGLDYDIIIQKSQHIAVRR